MKSLINLLFCSILLFLPACGSNKSPGCPKITGTPQYLTVPPQLLPSSEEASTPTVMQIKGRLITVDKVIEGPLCNGSWSGTVYVTCNIQVYPWKETPDFLENCNLSIAPGTVVYVAYHRDTAYYNGCSCHTGETATP